jgi:CHAT domain-containing protein
MGAPSRFSFPSLVTDSKGLQKPVILKNPMYRSGIALAGAQVTLDAWKRGETPPTDGDGILTAEEVGDLDLHGTWLVVLSACDTGIGEPRSGEGVMGLRRGFVQAGAQNLLMTLWPVFDVPSGKLMLDFYSALHQNNNPSKALAKVQRDWLVNLRSKYGLRPAVVMAGAFIVNSQGPIQ